MDKILVSIGVLAAFAAAFFAFNSFIYPEKQGVGPAATPQDATYVIDGRVITLVNGISETEAAPGSASKVVTRWFGNEVVADLDGDGALDTAALLTQEGGGSGIFFYVVAALKRGAWYEGSQAYFLGDRIAPQTTEMSQNTKHERVLVVNYADRAEGEPMTTPPSVGKSVWLKYDSENNMFGIVVQDFEGESANSSLP